jgi:L-ascorbate metabolism protein UlaG (beta-lactamase superfamily)
MKLQTTLAPQTDVTLTWWGCATIVIESGPHAIVIDPYLHPTEPRFDYIFCTHEHYDHADPATIEGLSQGPTFQKAIVARSCLLPSTLWYARQLTFSQPDQAVVLYPKYSYRTQPREFPGPTELQLDNWHVEGIEAPGEEADVAGPVEGPVPQLGFLIRDLGSGISFLHVGDLRWLYPELAELQGQADILFLPPSKLGLEQDARLLEMIRPRYIVPIHYRHAGDYPIPKLYQEDDPIEQKVQGHHFPGPDDPDAYLAELGKAATPLAAEILALRAGIPYEL